MPRSGARLIVIAALVAACSTPPAPGSPPNPEIPATAAKVRTGGIVLSLLVVMIVFLMVTKPF